MQMMKELRETQDRTNRITQQGQYITTMNSLSLLYGDEGPSRIETYFRTFESVTAVWDDYTRANLIASRLQGQAKLLYDALSRDEPTSYERVRNTILSGGASANSLRAKAQSQLSRGLTQEHNETFMSFGKRLLRVTRDSLLPETPESAVQDQASWHLMAYVKEFDPTVRGIMASMRLNTDYHTLLDQTVALMESNAASQLAHRRYDRSPGRFQQRFDDPTAGFHRAQTNHNPLRIVIQLIVN